MNILVCDFCMSTLSTSQQLRGQIKTGHYFLKDGACYFSNTIILSTVFLISIIQGKTFLVLNFVLSNLSTSQQSVFKNTVGSDFSMSVLSTSQQVWGQVKKGYCFLKGCCHVNHLYDFMSLWSNTFVCNFWYVKFVNKSTSSVPRIFELFIFISQLCLQVNKLCFINF